MNVKKIRMKNCIKGKDKFDWIIKFSLFSFFFIHFACFFSKPPDKFLWRFFLPANYSWFKILLYGKKCLHINQTKKTKKNKTLQLKIVVPYRNIWLVLKKLIRIIEKSYNIFFLSFFLNYWPWFISILKENIKKEN